MSIKGYFLDSTRAVIKTPPSSSVVLEARDYINKIKEYKGQDVTPIKIAERIVRGSEPRYDLAAKIQFPKEILDFQRRAAIEAYTLYGGRVILALDMGGGKTITSETILTAAPLPWLIICPSDKVYDFKEEGKRWHNIDYTIFKSGDKVTSDRMIVQYGLIEQVKDHPWNAIVIDESHLLKNPDSKRCKIITPMVQRAQVAVLLTGTPLLSCYSELWSQFNMLYKTVNYYEFTKRYCNASKTRFGWTLGKSRYEEEMSVLFDTYAIRINKEDMNLNLPELKRKEIKFDISEEKRKEFEELYEELEKLKAADKEIEIKLLVNKMVVLSAYAILDQSIELIIHEATEGTEETFVVFAYNRDILKKVSERLNELNISNVIIDGSVAKKKKHELIQDLRAFKYKVGLLSFCCSTGINLPPIKKTYYIQRVWTSTEMDQTEGRTHRIGAKDPIECIYLTGSGTYDYRQMSKLDTKSRLVASIMKTNKRFKIDSDC